MAFECGASATAFYAGFAGPGPDHGRRLARLECWGAGGADDSWRAASPWRQLNLPQIRLEPLLKAQAEELSPGRIRFGHELVGLEQDGRGVRATVRDNASGRHYAVRCPGSTCSARTAGGGWPAWPASGTRGSAW
jgi:2,4-dichlorophenol 6-monooxygenase